MITWFQNRRAKLKRDLDELKADVSAAVTHDSEFQFPSRGDRSFGKTNGVSSIAPFSEISDSDTDGTSSLMAVSYAAVMPFRITSFSGVTCDDDNVVSSSTGDHLSSIHGRL